MIQHSRGGDIQRRRREFEAMERQEALLVIDLAAVPRWSKKVRGKWVEDTKGDAVKSRFVATEVAYMAREDVHAGTPGLKAARLILSLAAARGHKIAIYDIVAAFIHAPMDELVVVYPPSGTLPAGKVFVLLKALRLHFDPAGASAV